uniref:Uncharacterized protein AlNc14C1169G12824 n=1 Tax=Albugo laibachii Nc14 TaxID=890382 RepID=F0X2K4_9STRA|nr:conserved hypothetical protein [Albugo laibachii Nc14]|eukprot:CCA28111.1 conserved hypothetical protein [Albugo laibachii Nc14]
MLYRAHQKFSVSTIGPFAAQNEEIRGGIFTEGVAAEYRSELLRKMKRITSMDQYLETRRDMLAVISQNAYAPEFERRSEAKQKLMPSKPKIPRQTRRFVSKTSRDPLPNRFNRKINRMLRKIQGNVHAVPTMEESLQD